MLSNKNYIELSPDDRTPLERSYPPIRPHIQRQTGIKGGVTDIFLSIAIVSLPFTLLSALLVGIIISKQVQNDQSSTVVSANDQGGGAVYYVLINSTTLALIASFSSSVASLAVASFMALVAYPVSRRLLKLSEAGRRRGLPTPYQFALLIKILNGGFWALWVSLKYVMGWKVRRKTVGVIKVAAFSLGMAAVFMLSIYLTDAWFHIATKTVEVVRLTPISPPTMSFGRGLSSECAAWYKNPPIYKNAGPLLTGDNGVVPCTIDIGMSNVFLIGATEAFKTFFNVSSFNQLVTFEDGNLTYVLLGDAHASDTLDFTADTVAMNTQCTPITRACNLTVVSGVSMPYYCSSGVNGDLLQRPNDNSTYHLGNDFWTNAFSDPALTVPANLSSNPTYVVISAIVNMNDDNTSPIYNDSEIVHPVHGGDAFIVLCQSTVYDVTYNWQNGSVSLSSVKPSNDTITTILNSPTAFLTPENQLVNGAVIGGLSNTSQGLADKLGVIYSQTSVGFAAGVFSERDNIAESRRENLLVSKVPVAPFYGLVGANLMAAGAGLLVGIVALCANAGIGVRDVQARLSIWGLVAHGFERNTGRQVRKIKDMFAESKNTMESSDVIEIERDSQSYSVIGFRKCKLE